MEVEKERVLPLTNSNRPRSDTELPRPGSSRTQQIAQIPKRRSSTPQARFEESQGASLPVRNWTRPRCCSGNDTVAGFGQLCLEKLRIYAAMAKVIRRFRTCQTGQIYQQNFKQNLRLS